MRTKIIAGNIVAVLAVGLASYFLVTSAIESAFLADVDQEIGAHHGLFAQSYRLSGYELLEQAVEQAADGDTQDVFTALDQDRQRTRAFERANAIGEWFERRNRSDGGAPELVLLVDDRGVVIARNQDRNRLHGNDLTRELGTLAPAIASGEARSDVWRFSAGQDKLLQVAIAPIRAPDGGVIGALLVGYDMSNGMATRVSELIGADVAILMEGGIYSSSLPSDRLDGLRGQLFGGAQQAASDMALAAEGAHNSEPFLVEVGGQQYIGIAGPVPHADSTQVAVAVLSNRTAEIAKASPTSTILVMTAIGLLIVLIYGFLIANSFLKPVAEMEESILAVINGRTDLRIDIESAEFGGLAYRINQLLNVFTNTPEEDSDGRVSSPPEAWGADAGGADESGGGADDGADDGDDALAAQLADEPADAYYARIYTEYVAAKEAAGENVANITQERFVKRLEANEKSLIKKHGCRMVRFQVQTRGTQVNLRPVIIR